MGRRTSWRSVVDIFSGMGGLSLGFREAGFNVRGFDHDKHAISTYRANVGPCDDADLRSDIPRIEADVLLGGPPCRPWSRLNLRRARREHGDRPLVGAFTKMVMRYEPAVFVLENVPLLEKDPLYRELVERAARLGYDTGSRVITYADFGAASARRRLFLFGSRSFEISRLLERLERLKRPARNVGGALAPYEGYGYGEFPDHEWAALRTIHKYSEKYRTERYGWYRLDAAKPARSFGNVQKTYILHPRSYDGAGPRVISVREAMAIVGFGDDFRFPAGVPMTAKYRMVAEVVSPVFSRALAEALRDLVQEGSL